MIAIKEQSTGMTMPKSCSECQFRANDYVCGLLECAFSCNHFKERNYNCPLVEIITCKDCDYCRFELVEGIPYYWCDKDNCPTSENFYCANAERRK